MVEKSGFKPFRESGIRYFQYITTVIQERGVLSGSQIFIQQSNLKMVVLGVETTKRRGRDCAGIMMSRLDNSFLLGCQLVQLPWQTRALLFPDCPSFPPSASHFSPCETFPFLHEVNSNSRRLKRAPAIHTSSIPRRSM